MGCGCVSAAHSDPTKAARTFLYTPSDGEFLHTLEKSELEDKKRILAFRRLLREGKFERCEQLERLVRNEGIPERYRWMCWKALSGLSDIYRPGAWERISRRIADPRVLEAIEKDLHRTFPGRDDFDEAKQKMMSQICIAYAGLHPTIGYVQGMNFIVGFLLIISNSPEDVFFMFVQIMIRYSASLLFHFGLPLLKLYTYQFRTLLEHLFPDVHKHFEEQCITPELYSTKWFLTLFSHILTPSEEDEARPAASSSVVRVSRIWDYLLCDGLQSIVLVALATIKVLRPQLVKADTEAILELLSLRGPTYLLPDSGSVIKTAVSLKHKSHGSLKDYLPKMRRAWEEQNPADADLLAQAEEVLCVAMKTTVDSLPAEGMHETTVRESGADSEPVACAPIATADDQSPKKGEPLSIVPGKSSAGTVAEERCPDSVETSDYAQGGVSDARVPPSSATAAPQFDPEDLEVQVTLAVGRAQEADQSMMLAAGRGRSSSAEVPERLKEEADPSGAVRRSRSMELQAGTDHRLRPSTGLEPLQAPPRVMEQRKETESPAATSSTLPPSYPSWHSRATTPHDPEVRTTTGREGRSSGSGSRTATPTMLYSGSPLPPHAMPRPMASPAPVSLPPSDFVPPDRHSPSCCGAQCPETFSCTETLKREDTVGSAGNLSVESEGHMPSPPKATVWTSPGATREVSAEGEVVEALSPHMSEAARSESVGGCSRGGDTVGVLLESMLSQTHPEPLEGHGEFMRNDPSTGALSDHLELSIGSLVAVKGGRGSLHAQAQAAGFGKAVSPAKTFPMN